MCVLVDQSVHLEVVRSGCKCLTSLGAETVGLFLAHLCVYVGLQDRYVPAFLALVHSQLQTSRLSGHHSKSCGPDICLPSWHLHQVSCSADAQMSVTSVQGVCWPCICMSANCLCSVAQDIWGGMLWTEPNSGLDGVRRASAMSMSRPAPVTYTDADQASA